MKRCPFCKKSIELDSASCPYCHCTLIEEVLWKKAPPEILNAEVINQKKVVDKKNHWASKESIMKHIPLTLLIIVLVITISNTFIKQEPISIVGSSKWNGDSKNVFSQPAVNPPPRVEPTYKYKEVEDNSLLNWTVFKKMPMYFRGKWSLNIDNWTDSDAVVKLVSNSLNKSVFTFYIKANTKFTISDISDWDYRLFFHHWNDWNVQTNSFNRNWRTSVFEDVFVFNTTKTDMWDYINTKYTDFSVTLYSIVWWNARINSSSISDFASY